MNDRGINCQPPPQQPDAQLKKHATQTEQGARSIDLGKKGKTKNPNRNLNYVILLYMFRGF